MSAGGCLPRGVCLVGCLARGCLPGGCLADAPQPPPIPVDRILDTRLWKHYLSATSFADGKNRKNTIDSAAFLCVEDNTFLAHILQFTKPLKKTVCFSRRWKWYTTSEQHSTKFSRGQAGWMTKPKLWPRKRLVGFAHSKCCRPTNAQF